MAKEKIEAKAEETQETAKAEETQETAKAEATQETAKAEATQETAKAEATQEKSKVEQLVELIKTKLSQEEHKELALLYANDKEFNAILNGKAFKNRNYPQE
jgi:uncharacterized membrane protein YqiK